MNENMPFRNGGRILVDQLRVHGTDTAFCVPGESYLPVLDALYDARERVRLIVCRQEGGAAFMAEAYGKLTGKPGICFVTRGPGATNASIGVHTAYQDSTPMILFIGQSAATWSSAKRFRKWTTGVCTANVEMGGADRSCGSTSELVSHAFHIAVSGRPGPVVLALPEDMLASQAVVADVKPYKRVKPHPGVGDMHELRDMLAQSHKPLVILGGGDWSAQACNDIRAFIEANNLPAGCSFRRQDLLDNRHPNYCGEVGIGINPLLGERVRSAD